ncbi:MAG: hypothetical protein KGJ41_16770 [Rhodospirillales bacterium]|nr:hypothetical protein [Rhodospirillales bacterium]MDE2200668.1 hypothetical protein [Rhodospirillales bacterium]
MVWLRTILSEILGLFVDDGAFAVAILAWIALLWWLAPWLTPTLRGPLLFAGLAAILLESALRRARR